MLLHVCSPVYLTMDGSILQINTNACILLVFFFQFAFAIVQVIREMCTDGRKSRKSDKILRMNKNNSPHPGLRTRKILQASLLPIHKYVTSWNIRLTFFFLIHSLFNNRPWIFPMLCCSVLSRSVGSDSATPWTVALQTPMSMEFSR